MVCIGYGGEQMGKRNGAIDDNDCETIVGEKSLRYKRNVLVIAFVIMAVQFIDGLDLSQIPVVNLSIGNNAKIEHPEYLAWSVALLIFGYNVTAYIFYGRTDYLKWRDYVLDETGSQDIRLLVEDDIAITTFIGKGDDRLMFQLKDRSYDGTNYKMDYLYEDFAKPQNNVESFNVYDRDKDRMQHLYKVAYRFEFQIPLAFMIGGGLTVILNLAQHFPY
jgi:hypothetical protein